MEPLPPLAPRTALFVPASRPRMIAKAAVSAADLIVLDMEDAVRAEDKADARAALAESLALFAGRPVAVRINPDDSPYFAADMAAVEAASAALVLIPKVERVNTIARVAMPGRQVMAMIETPAGVLAAPAIAAADGVVALFIGTNDLAAGLRLPPSSGRAAMGVALQSVVLAARAAGVWAIDGVFNALSDPQGLAAECAEGRAIGYDGKSLIHPDQIDIANRAFAPGEAELEDARALIAAASGGAERFRDRMVEDLHVEMARATIARAR